MLCQALYMMFAWVGLPVLWFLTYREVITSTTAMTIGLVIFAFITMWMFARIERREYLNDRSPFDDEWASKERRRTPRTNGRRNGGNGRLPTLD